MEMIWKIRIGYWELKRRVRDCWSLLMRGENKIVMGEDSYFVEMKVKNRNRKIMVLEELCGLMDSDMRVYEIDEDEFLKVFGKMKKKLIGEGVYLGREERKKFVKKCGFR